jgi:hypothetical protein
MREIKRVMFACSFLVMFVNVVMCVDALMLGVFYIIPAAALGYGQVGHCPTIYFWKLKILKYHENLFRSILFYFVFCLGL